MRFCIGIFFLSFFHFSILSQQKIIKLVNSGFEDSSSNAKEIKGWHGCQPGSNPDIQPGQWDVFNKASEGNQFIGLCTREDGTFESIGQKTSETLKQDGCYEFNLDLANSRTYAKYNKPIKLRIWGGTSTCNKTQLLKETKFIDHSDWRTYKVDFYLKQDIDYIILEAFYKNGRFSHKGNILIDNISEIKTCIRA